MWKLYANVAYPFDYTMTVLDCDEGLQTVSLKMWGAYWDCHTKERLKLEVSEKKVAEGGDLEIRRSPKER